MEKIVSFIVLWFLTSSVEGRDPFQSGITLNCFQRRAIRGCNGTLVGNFKPRSKGAGLNAPETELFLFTRSNPLEPEFLHECGGQLPENTNFNPKDRTEIVIHGYINQPCLTSYHRDIRDELLHRGSYNVILVVWTWGSFVDYYSSIQNEPVVGEQVAFVIKNIMKQTGVSGNNFHIIGQSSGAHVAGFVGQNVKNLRRITGLDPSFPGHIGKPLSELLDRSDAQLVDIVHTSAAHCDLFGFGYPYQLGHADFYVNGGSFQPNCYASGFSSILRGDLLAGFATILIPPVCSHQQSLLYYKVSINPNGCEFVGVECPDYASYKSGACGSCGRKGSRCAVMGMDFEDYYKDDGRNHTYYLGTEFFCPFCDKSMYNEFKRSLSTSTESNTKKPKTNLNVNIL